MAIERARGLARVALMVGVIAVLGDLFMNSQYGILFGEVPSYPHYLQTVVPSAFEVIPGERVVAGGLTVGEITAANVTKTGQAHIVMGLDSGDWPVPSNSVLTLRMGGTIKYTDRFVSITKGTSATDFAGDATIPARQFIVPVEYDQLFNIFNAPTRAGLRALFTDGGPTFKAAASPFHRALPLAPRLLGQASAVFADLGYDQQALSTLVSSSAELSDAVASANPGVRNLVQGAATTFSTIASQSTALDTVVRAGGQDFYDVGHVTFHAASTLPRLTVLARRLKPTIGQLDRIASPLNGALDEVVSVEPTAVDTLTTVRRASPMINTLLRSARTKLFPQLAPVSTLGAKELDCVRPYTPDLVSFIQGWSGYLSLGENDPKVNFFHGALSFFPVPNAVPLDTEQLKQIVPGLSMAFPAVPGTQWNQPWYQPQCNITANALNPADDPEAGTLDPNASETVPYPMH